MSGKGRRHFVDFDPRTVFVRHEPRRSSPPLGGCLDRFHRDLDGVNLAGVQALDTRTAAQEARIATLEHENAELRARLDALERRLAAPAPKP